MHIHAQAASQLFGSSGLWEVAGRVVGHYDLMVAATALERDGEVATFNQWHFAQVKGLTVIEPS